MLRMHRMNYQSASSIESELAWLQALHRDTFLLIPRPIPEARWQITAEICRSGRGIAHGSAVSFYCGQRADAAEQFE